MFFMIKKVAFRMSRLIYVLVNNNIKKWPSILGVTNLDILFQTILLRHRGNETYQKEISYLKEKGEIDIFPYKNIKQIGEIISGYNDDEGLPYIIHNNRHLYFPDTWTQDKVRKVYKNFIEVENILGGGFAEKTPHQYQTETFCVKGNDILLDVGCAEALFTLDILGKVNIKKAILFESDSQWFKPLNATFKPEIESGKVVLIEKMVTDKNSDKSITINSALENEDYGGLFIKMDIEGYESKVVETCRDLMKLNKDIRFSCCTYHKQHDADVLMSLFKSNGYNTEFSDGYMLFFTDKLITFPYFRKGIIRASKNIL